MNLTSARITVTLAFCLKGCQVSLRSRRGITQEDNAQQEQREKKTPDDAQRRDSDKKQGHRQSLVFAPAKKERTTPYRVAKPWSEPSWRYGQGGRWIWVENPNADHR